jgi:hypothetical protein
LENKRIVIISSEAWGDVFVSKHHYAKVLSKANKVYFINPPSFKWRLSSLLKMPFEAKLINDKLTVIDYGNPLPFLFHLPYLVQIWVFKSIIRRLSKNMEDLSFPDIVWSFDLKRFYDLKIWHAKNSIFHAVELIDHPFFIKDAPHRHQVIKTADLVVVIADLIEKQASRLNSNILKINHGIDLESFENISPGLKLPGKNKIKVGFVGNFQVSFDFELLNELSNSHPDIDFVMIGPVANSNLGKIDPKIQERIIKLQSNVNVIFLGKVPSYELPKYMISFDLNLIIYGDEFHAGHCNPHKLMSCFYFGKATVSSFIDEYKSMPDLVKMVEYNKDLLQLFNEVINNLEDFNSKESVQKRKTYAERHQYHLLIHKIETALND